jgi:hypothetical protein
VPEPPPRCGSAKPAPRLSTIPISIAAMIVPGRLSKPPITTIGKIFNPTSEMPNPPPAARTHSTPAMTEMTPVALQSSAKRAFRLIPAAAAACESSDLCRHALAYLDLRMERFSFGLVWGFSLRPARPTRRLPAEAATRWPLLRAATDYGVQGQERWVAVADAFTDGKTPSDGGYAPKQQNNQSQPGLSDWSLSRRLLPIPASVLVFILTDPLHLAADLAGFEIISVDVGVGRIGAKSRKQRVEVARSYILACNR